MTDGDSGHILKIIMLLAEGRKKNLIKQGFWLFISP